MIKLNRACGEHLHLIGVEFGKVSRNVVGLRWRWLGIEQALKTLASLASSAEIKR
jgi:hypothetical protein